MATSSKRRKRVRPRPLEDYEVTKILAYMNSKSDTWKGHRLYALTATVTYAGLTSGEALSLKCADCNLDLGTITVPRRAKFAISRHPCVVSIPLALVKILKEWLPRRRDAKSARGIKASYGKRLADDGHTLIPDEAQLAILADIRRWRGEGWTLQQIASELDSRGVPTMTGKPKWNFSTVSVILKRERQPRGEPTILADIRRWRGEGWTLQQIASELDSRGVPTMTGKPKWSPQSVMVLLRKQRRDHADVPVTSDVGEREEGGPENDPGWLFPNITGHGHWISTIPHGWSPLDQLRDAGKALGIEGLMFESLRRFYLEHARTVLDLGQEESSDVPGEVPNPNAERPDPVPWRGTRERLESELAGIASKATRDVVRTLIEWMPQRLTKYELGDKSSHPDAPKLLGTFARSGTRLARAVDMPRMGPGRPRRGYRIAVEIIPG